MRKNKFFMLGIITVFVAILSLTFVSSTFARYTSSVSGNDTARVAQWAWNYKDAALSKVNSTVAFDLFETILDSDGTEEEKVSKTEQIIAPGTSGKFVISFENESEVAANLKVTFSQLESDVTIPIVFSFNEDFTASTDNIETLSWDEDLAINAEKVEKTVYWKWDFNNDIDVDTALGWKGTDTIKVVMDVVFTQLD